jgi:hypothetical protein
METCSFLCSHLVVMVIGRWKKKVLLLLELDLSRDLMCVYRHIHQKLLLVCQMRSPVLLFVNGATPC